MVLAVKVDNIPPFSAALEFNGWPAGIIDGHGATIASGDLANIFTLEEALRAKAAV